MSYGLKIQATGGGAITDLATYGLYVIDGEFPIEPEPYTETVNIPSKAGGYTFYNEAQPATISLDVVVYADDISDLVSNLQSIAAATVSTSKYRLLPDIFPNNYWTGRRINGIPGIPAGVIDGPQTFSFTMLFVCDDPTMEDREGT